MVDTVDQVQTNARVLAEVGTANLIKDPEGKYEDRVYEAFHFTSLWERLKDKTSDRIYDTLVTFTSGKVLVATGAAFLTGLEPISTACLFGLAMLLNSYEKRCYLINQNEETKLRTAEISANEAKILDRIVNTKK